MGHPKSLSQSYTGHEMRATRPNLGMVTASLNSSKCGPHITTPNMCQGPGQGDRLGTFPTTKRK